MPTDPRATMSIQLGAAPMRAQARRPGAPFRMLIVADLSGDAPRPPLSERQPLRIDVDNAERVFARLAPSLSIETLPGDRHRLSFASLEDFHPDALIARIPLLGGLRELAAGAAPGSTGAGAASATAPASPSPGATGSDFDRLIGRAPAPSPAPAARTLVEDWIRGIAGQGAPAATPPDAGRASAAQGTLALLLRQVLRDPAFRALEATWRGVQRLVADLGGEPAVEIGVLDLRADELLEDIVAHRESLGDTVCGRCLKAAAQTPWSVIVLGGGVRADATGLVTLSALGAIAHAFGASVLAGTSLQDAHTPHGAAPAPVMAWTTTDALSVRRTSAAAHVALAAGRVLARLPYGRRADPIESFAFEEIDDPADPAQYLWGNASLHLARLAARASLGSDGGIDLDSQGEIDDLPAFSHRDAHDEPRLRPVVETALSDEAADRWLAAGLMPVIAHASRAMARLPRWQSFADPPTPLQGPWG